MKEINFVQQDKSFYYKLRNDLQPWYEQYVEVHGFIGTAPYGTYLYESRQKKEFFIELFSPGLERNLPDEYFRALVGGLYGVFEEVKICGLLNAATSFRGIASLSSLKYIKVKIEDDSFFEYKILQK